jgi:hypothetical protein
MDIELTEPLQRALDAQLGQPLRVVDPRTHKVYILLAAEHYERLKDLIAPGPLTDDERRVVLQGVWRRANWDDPRMDEYEALHPRKNS